MKVNFSTALQDVRGNVIKLPDNSDVTLRWAAIEALMGPPQTQGEKYDQVEILTRGRLASKINSSDDGTEFSVAEINKTNMCIAKHFAAPAIPYAADLLLDPKPVDAN